MTRNKNCVEIPEKDRIELAKEFDSSCVAALSEFVPPEALKKSYKEGSVTLSQCAAAFKRIDKDVFAWLNSRSITLKSFYSVLAAYTVDRCGCKTVRQCRSYLKAIMRNPMNQRGVLAYIESRRESLEKNASVIKSVLRGVDGLCEITFRKNRVSRPSAMLNAMFENGSLVRYLGGKLPYHFMALVPDVGKLIEKHATRHVNIYDVNQTVMDDEFALLYKSLGRYRNESMYACRCITGNPIVIKGILPFTDEYYYTKYLPEHSKTVK